MRRILYIALIMIFLPVSVYAVDDALMLAYSDRPLPLNSIAHFLENDISVRIITAREQAGNKVDRDESFRAVEVRKKSRIAPLSAEADAKLGITYLLSKERAELVREENSRNQAVKLEPRTATIKFDSTGRRQKELSLINLPFESLPVIFPNRPVVPGEVWYESQEILVDEQYPLTLNGKYQLDGFKTLIGEHIAEVSYTLTAELNSTEVTDNPAMLQTIERMRSRGIERIALSGKGKMAFNIAKGIPVVQTTDLMLEIAMRTVSQDRREVREFIRELHKAEVTLAP